MEQQKRIRQFIRVTGQVQGVGFRFRAKYAAESLGITGWVRNEWDGSVEMEVQGEPEQIDRMFRMINQGTYVAIERIERKELPLAEREFGFHMRD